jgi:signal transduction histidine kinase
MFHSARIKLTVWYVCIIMLVSVLFSIMIYTEFNSELVRFEHLHRLRIEREQQNIPYPDFPRRLAIIDPDMIAETRARLMIVLLLVNSGILILSGGAAYFLAGKTLKPIKDMVEEQHQFIADASHELRTPLTSIRSEVEVNLRDKLLDLKTAKILLKSNLEEVVKMQTLTDRLMELAQFQKNTNGYKWEETTLKEISENAIKMVEVLAKNKKIKILNKTRKDKIIGVKESLTELIIILLDNAVKYSPDKTTITISSEKTDHSLYFSVKDEGIGIDQKHHQHIFNRFYRADESRSKDSINGFGLGLSIAHKIVELHNGTISTKSALNKGSVFTVKLPINHA